ncbi:MAG: serine hydrolase, partial [Candidatus Aminicenantes bacterium]|nr:serine hydrolase [Candidatus Aminicenantes bacterium]
MKRLKKSLLVLLCSIFFLTLSYAEESAARVDALFAEWDKRDSPGCSLAVVRDGKIIYKSGYGMANLELGIPITPQSVFYIGSVSKQFTAFCIALLAREGKLALDDDIRQHIPEMPDYGNPVTIRHLLHHTSGIRDYLELENIAGIDAGSYHEQDVLELLARQKSLNFAPGEEYLYSNGGYFLLGI